MRKVCIFVLLLTSALAFTIQSTICEKQFMAGIHSLESAFKQSDPNAMIDKIADTIDMIPDILTVCVGKEAASNFQK